MKSKIFSIGIIALLLVFVLFIVSCRNPASPSDNNRNPGNNNTVVICTDCGDLNCDCPKPPLDYAFIISITPDTNVTIIFTDEVQNADGYRIYFSSTTCPATGAPINWVELSLIGSISSPSPGRLSAVVSRPLPGSLAGTFFKIIAYNEYGDGPKGTVKFIPWEM